MTWLHLLIAYTIGTLTGLSLGYLLRSAQHDQHFAARKDNDNAL